VTSVLRHVAALVTGVAVALAGMLVHRETWKGLPFGLMLALLTTFAVAWAFRVSSRPRLTTSYALGWLVVFGIVVSGRPEGDFLLASDPRGYAMMVSSVVLVVVGLTALAARPDIRPAPPTTRPPVAPKVREKM
jgi:hypothetical protein